MPDWTREIRGRLSMVRLSPAREAEVVEELNAHLEERWRELVAGGAPQDEATRIVRTELAASDLLARRISALRQARWVDPAPPAAARAFSIDGLKADLRQAVRTLRSSPSFTLAALLVLTLGIGATTAIFSVVDAVVLRALPFADADRIVAVGERTNRVAGKAAPKGFPAMGGVDQRDPEALNLVRPQNYLDWVARQQVFESMAAINLASEMSLIVPGGEPEDLSVQRVSPAFFDVLRIRPALGRAFTGEQEVEQRPRVVVLSHSLWSRRFNRDPNVVGKTIALDDGSYEVLGVLPDGVTYPVGAARPTDLWVPYVPSPDDRIRGRMMGFSLQVIARLRPDISIEQARSQMAQVAAALEEANPTWNRGSTIGVRPLRDHLVGASMRSWMLMLLAAVGIVLLIACINVANLLLARATTSHREIAVRAALGASRWRLVRQFMVESLLLSAAGTVLAIGLAWWTVDVLRSAMPEGVPRVTTIAVNLRVLLSASVLALVAGALFGIVPALQSSVPNLAEALSQGTRAGGQGRTRSRVRSLLVVGEIALAVVLVVGSALFIGSFIRVMRIDPGLNPDGVLTLQVFQPSVPGQPRSDLTAAFAEIRDRLTHTSGVTHAAISTGLPFRVNMNINSFDVKGRTLDVDRAVSIKRVTPGYHETLGIALKRGRLFGEPDAAGVVVINETAAKRFFGAEDPVGQTAIVDRMDRIVVGVVADVVQGTLEAVPVPEVYLPLNQDRPSSGFVAIRTNGNPYDLLPAAKTAVFGALPNVPVRHVATLNERIAQQTAQRRLTMLLLGLFGVLGLLIAAVGVYGVMAYLVSQRTREIGVRMALGATRTLVLKMVVRQAGALAAIGVVLGAVVAWTFTGAVQSFLFGLQPNDVWAFAIAAVTLLAAALIASAIPARRASSVDPTIALRAE
jgi:putative ABC transport system permease protein